MLLYTFYPTRPDGASTVFETYELDDDDSALARARRVLRDHPSAAEVAIWQGERKVDVLTRASDMA